MPTHVITVNGDAVNQSTGDATVPIFKRKIILTDAQIKNLPTIPVELVPAPGAGEVLIFGQAIFKRAASFVPYSVFQEYDGLEVRYATGNAAVDQGFYFDSTAGVHTLGELLSNSYPDGHEFIFMDGPKIVVTNTSYSTTPNVLQLVTNISNQPLVLLGLTVDNVLTGGDPANTLEVTVFYSIVDL